MNEELPEDIGSAYFDSLTKLCFLQDAPRNIFTCQLVYKMHDLIHDLTRQILQHEMVTSLQNMAPDCILRCRYLSLTSTTEKVSSNLFDKAHALYVSGGNISFDKPMKKCCNIRSVVLDYTSDTPFPLFILKFEFLGYLRICNVNCTEFPEAISSCWNLQALHVTECKGFSTLPESIGKLKKLRTLELLMVTDLRSLPQSIGDCQDLRSLQLYSCYELIEIPTSIVKIQKLIVLDIVSCVCVYNQLQRFTWEHRNLDRINLSGCHSLRDLPSAFSCRTLRTLDLSRTDITSLPQWVTLICTLECIKLEYCMMFVELPKGITNLRRLEVLNLNGCLKLRCMPSGFGHLTRLRWLGLFVVGCGGDDARLSELENLDMISGWLRICNLKYLKDSGEANKACLKKKNNIHSLTLNWSREMEEKLVSDIEEDLRVLDSLEPPSGIEFLQIIGYLGPHLPCWMTKQRDSSCLESIMPNQTSPPKFLCLTELSLELLLNLKSLQGLMELPSLKNLLLIGMPNLEELWITNGLETGEEQVGVQYCFPVLTNLIIKRCPKLFVKPWLPPCLGLTFEESNEQLLSPGSLLSYLPTPPVSSSCNVLVTVPTLKELRLHRVTGSAPVWQVLQHFTSLQLLHIVECSTLCTLPEGIQHLTSLQQLELVECDALTLLPEGIGQLSALRSLRIYECSALESLPLSIKRLTALQTLYVFGCRGLTKRYEEEVGDDWHLISHIPDVTVVDMELLAQRHRAYYASVTS
jgi:Leucine-rich repeat (LRR) protein